VKNNHYADCRDYRRVLSNWRACKEDKTPSQNKAKLSRACAAQLGSRYWEEASLAVHSAINPNVWSVTTCLPARLFACLSVRPSVSQTIHLRTNSNHVAIFLSIHLFV